MNTTEVDVRRGATSASNALADSLCQARHQRQKGIPHVDSEYSEHGQQIHAALASTLDLHSLTLEQRETFDRHREIEKKLILQMFPDESGARPIKVFREERFWCLVDGKWEHSGQADLVVRRGNQALIMDYKSLPGDVPEASNNRQLRELAVLVKGTLLVDEVATVINQPLVTMSPEVCVYTAEDLKSAEEEMWVKVRNSNAAAPAANAGEVQCKFCRAKRVCPEYNRFAGSMVPGFMSIVDVPVESWTPKQRAIFCDQYAVAENWLQEVKTAMKEGLQGDPGFVEGWTLRPGNRIETITDPQVCFQRFATLGGKVEQFMGAVKVQKTALREAINALTGAKGKALDQAMQAVTEGIVAVNQNAPSLVRVKEGGSK
jgi:hypothetical protein